MRGVVVALRPSIGLFLILGATLSACGQKSDDDPLILNATAETGRVEEKFGEGFGEAFRADPNSEPREVTDSDVAPLSTTTEPVPIN